MYRLGHGIEVSRPQKAWLKLIQLSLVWAVILSQAEVLIVKRFTKNH